jgi:ABC-type antimicrobial peptide transport system permease subunit
VGIVGDIRSTRIKEEPGMEFYRPWSQENFPFVSIAVLSTLNTDAVTRLAQSALTKVNPGLAIAIPQSMDAIVAQALGQARLMMILLGLFAGIALLLAAVGIYGAVSYSVAQRTGEIGVRIALGAQARDVLRLILGQGMTPVVIGLATGLAAALALGRLLRTQLYQISPHNPTLLFTTAVVLALVALLACLVPAQRAANVDPIQALRTE